MTAVVIEKTNGYYIHEGDDETALNQYSKLAIGDKIGADAVYKNHVDDVVEDVALTIKEYIGEHFEKYGPQRVGGMDWVAIVTEEWGETVSAYLKEDYENLFHEGMQAIACIVRLLVEAERELVGAHEAEATWYERAR